MTHLHWTVEKDGHRFLRLPGGAPVGIVLRAEKIRGRKKFYGLLLEPGLPESELMADSQMAAAWLESQLRLGKCSAVPRRQRSPLPTFGDFPRSGNKSAVVQGRRLAKEKGTRNGARPDAQ